MGNLDIVGYLHTATKQDLMRLTVKQLETTLRQAEEHGVNQLVAIFDLDHFNLRQFAWKPGKKSALSLTRSLTLNNDDLLAMELVISLLQLYEANYPEILKVCYIING